MKKDILKDILLLQNQKGREETIPRDLLKKVRSYKNTKFVIIISGIRRCGKSTLLEQFRTKNAYYINFDDERFIDFSVKDFQTLYEVLVELFGEKNTFFFDEIQNIKGWERFVRRLHNENKKIYITGSNASMLSKEMGTHLTGRNITLKLYPFSFKEFLVHKKYQYDNKNLTSIDKSTLQKHFNEYIHEGGFPEYLQTKKADYLKNVYENILYRDIITRYKLAEKPLKETTYFAASNIGKEISFNTVMKITGLTSTTTIREYFSYLENSYLIFLVPRYDFSLKKQTYAKKKIYMIDQAMARIIGFRPAKDSGRLLENIVFLALKRQGFEIFYHKGKKECDFVVRKQAKIQQAIQVTQSLNQETKKREIEGLLEAMKSYELNQGLILTLDGTRPKDLPENVIVKPIWEWLLEEE